MNKSLSLHVFRTNKGPFFEPYISTYNCVWTQLLNYLRGCLIKKELIKRSLSVIIATTIIAEALSPVWEYVGCMTVQDLLRVIQLLNKRYTANHKVISCKSPLGAGKFEIVVANKRNCICKFHINHRIIMFLLTWLDYLGFPFFWSYGSTPNDLGGPDWPIVHTDKVGPQKQSQVMIGMTYMIIILKVITVEVS